MLRYRGRALVGVLVLALSVPQANFAASHREAPITALDQKADITDWFAFVNPEPGRSDKVIMILNVDPFLEPSNGPNYFPFDPGIKYAMNVDNNHDGDDDLSFEFRFKTDIRQPGVFTGFVGGLLGIPPITALDGAGSEGLSLSQTYTVSLVKNGSRHDLTAGRTLFAVPTNVGPRTMPDYDSLRAQGIYELDNGIRVFAGTVADPFFIDLGAAFDSLNFRVGGVSTGVLSPAQDANDKTNFAPNALAGFNVNSIVLEVPITMLTKDGKVHPSCDKEAVIGTYGATYRRTGKLLSDERPSNSHDGWTQIQRMGNALINELIIGTGSKDKWSQDEPKNDSQFAAFDLDPLLAKLFGIPVPPAPRLDLLPLVVYKAPICPGCSPNGDGPIADLLRLNTGVAPTPAADQRRLGLLAGDPAGYPNGRRPVDDVVDISARVVAGILVNPTKFGTRIGDGVNIASQETPLVVFPFVAPAYSGRNSSHEGPGQSGCPTLPGGICPAD